MADTDSLQSFDEMVDRCFPDYVTVEVWSGKSINISELVGAISSNFPDPIFDADTIALKLLDIRIQMLFIFQDYQSNVALFKGGFRLNSCDATKESATLVAYLSNMQSIIFKARTYFERIMNFVYYFEKGKEFEEKKSKKGKFFEFLEKDETFKKWNYLLPYKHVLELYDNLFRSPETHKNSTLRSYITNAAFRAEHGGELSQRVLSINNTLLVWFWVGLKDIIYDGHVSQENIDNIARNAIAYSVIVVGNYGESMNARTVDLGVRAEADIDAVPGRT